MNSTLLHCLFEFRDYITEAVDENGVRNALVRFGILE